MSDGRRQAAMARARSASVAAAMLAVVVACGPSVASAQSEPAQCRLVRIAEWPVRFVGNKILVDGAINGQKIAVAIDTGAMMTIVHRPTARRLGLPLREAPGVRMFGVGGETRVESAQADEVTIGDATVRRMTLFVAGEQDTPAGFDVLLGEDFFYKVDVEFDLAHDAIRLFEPRGCEGASLAYWASDGGSSVDIEPVSPRQPRILFDVEINGVSVDAVLDSGAAISVLDSGRARAAGVTPDTPGVNRASSIRGLGAKAVDTWVGTFDSIAIGNERIRDTPLRFADLAHDAHYTAIGSNVARSASGTASLLVGADFIRAHRLLVSHTRRRMYFTYVGGPVFGVATAGARGGDAPPTTDSPAK